MSTVWDRSMTRGGSERSEHETRIEIINDQKLSLSLRGDISRTGSRIGINKNAFQRENSPLLTTFDSLIENHYLLNYNDLKFFQFYIIGSIRIRNRWLYSTSVYLLVENLFTRRLVHFFSLHNQSWIFTFSEQSDVSLFV